MEINKNNKRVAVITRHAITNYGSILQTIALQRKIEDLGFSCEIIDFIRKDEEKGRRVISEGKRKKIWGKNFFTLVLYCIIRYPLEFISDTKFENNRNRYLNMTKRYSSREQLLKDKPEADIYMTGSDQVWGKIIDGQYEWAYFLDFCDKKDRKVSYAASFGIKPNATEFQKGIALLKKYDKITVREDVAVDILNEYDIDALQVLDPTFLLTKEEWEDLLEIPKRIIKDDYVMIYQIHNNKNLELYAENFAKRAGIKLIRVSPSLHQIQRNGKFIFSPSLGSFLSYLKNAKYLITDSFHGTAFSLIFNTPLVTVLPKSEGKSRNISLLHLVGMKERIVDNLDDYSLINKSVSFDYVNKILYEQRNISSTILEEMLQKE